MEVYFKPRREIVNPTNSNVVFHLKRVGAVNLKKKHLEIINRENFRKSRRSLVRKKIHAGKNSWDSEVGYWPFSTNVFLEVKNNNLKNLSNTKVFYVHEDCLRNLVRAKSALRARKSQKSIFGAIDLYPPHVPSHVTIV